MEREEARAVWRNTQRQIDDLTYKLGETRDHIDAVATRLDNFIAESATRDRITDQRLRETDSRIDKLISAMGEFLRVLPSQPLP
jgi:predicted RNase H-like nuclease (RuvC/YqgF family)